MKTKFITDSMAGLSRRYIDAHGITVLSRTISIGNDTFTEGNMSYPMFYESISNGIDNMKAIDISEDEFFVVFQKFTMIGLNIVCTVASSQISKAYENALKAKEKVMHLNHEAVITIIDSKSNSNQHGHITMVGVEYHDEGAGYDLIVTQMQNSVEKNHLYLCPDKNYASKQNTKGLRRSFPIFTVKDGKSVIYKNVKSRKNGLETLVALIEEDVHTGFVRHVTIMHVDNEDGASDLKKRIQDKAYVDIAIVPSSPVLDCDAGVGTLGLAWNVV